MPPHPALCQPGRGHAQRERERSPPSDLRARQVRDDACERRARPPPSPRAMRDPLRLQGETGSAIAASNPGRGPPARQRMRRRSRPPCRQAPGRSARERSAPSQARRQPRRRVRRRNRRASVPSSRLRTRGTATKIAATAVNESWKPGFRAAPSASTPSARALPTARSASDQKAALQASRAKPARPRRRHGRQTAASQRRGRTRR